MEQDGNILRLFGIVEESVVDGPGFRYTVFVQGCPHGCPGCHNPGSHPFEGGTLRDIDSIFQEICQNPLLKGVTFSGGEPFCQPGPLARLAEMVHAKGLDVMIYSGWTLEQLQAMDDPAVQALLNQADYLVDGPFLLAERDLDLTFRGSANQRVLDMNKTRATGEPVWAYFA